MFRCFTGLTFSWLSVQFDGEGCADVDTVQDGQQDLGQPEQVTEVIEAKVDEIPGQVHHLRGAAGRSVLMMLCIT